MPSAISLKKLTASNWSAENEVDSTPVEGDTAQSDKHRHDIKSKKRSDRGDGRLLTSRVDVDTILDAKRKRTVPLAELQLTEWLKENFEPMEDGYLSGRKMYEFYKQNCILQGINVLELTPFNRQLSNVLGGKRYLIKEGSDYKGLVSEKKKKETKKTESLHHKMKDIIIEALKEGGSPKKGLRFVWIKHYIIAKYPALRLDLRPAYLKVALERAVRFGYVELVKGMGMSGYYRLPGDYPEDEEDEKKKKKKKTKKPDEGGKEKEGGENGVKDGEGGKEGEEAKDGQTKEEKDVNGKGEEGASEEEKKDSKKSKKKKRSSKRKPRPRTFHGVSRHVDPRTIDDVFPMAMTFMCEPKDASSLKIKKYIQKYFPSVDLEANFKKTLLNGCEKGLWEQVTGTGSSGSFRLQVDDINPLKCTTLEDMICLAILACHEPKQSSVNLLKQYIIEYHPNFNIDKRPYHFKRALEKAERTGKIIRLSGIGGTGSFQLAEPFTPCPSWLGGEEDSDIEEDIEEVTQVQVEPLYKVRPSKRRGMGRVAAAKGRQPDFISYTSPHKSTKPKKRKRKVSYKEEDENESEVEESPKRSKSRTEKSASKSRRRKLTSESEEESEEDDPLEYTPKKTASRGGSKSSRQQPGSKTINKSSKGGKFKPKASTPSKPSRKAPMLQKEEEEEEGIEEKPAKKRKQASKKGKSPSGKSASKRRRKLKSSHREGELSDEEEQEPKSRSPSKKSRMDYEEDEGDSEREEQTRKVKGSSSRRRALYTDSEDEGEIRRKKRDKRYYDEDESLSEGEELPAKPKSRKSSSKKTRAEPLYTSSEEEGEVTSRRKLYHSDDEEEKKDKPSKSSKKSSKKSNKKRR